MAIEHRRIGASDLIVSTIGLGSWLTFSGGVAKEQTAACTRAAYEAGVTFFDTANVYGDGAAEEAWGEILAPTRGTPTCSRPSSTSRCPTAAVASRASRSSASSTLRCDGCASTTSTSTSATGTTTRRRWRRRWRRSARSSPRARSATSGSRVERRADRGSARDPRRRAVRLRAAAVLAAASRAGDQRRLRRLSRAADLARRLVAAGPGRPDGQYRPGAPPPPGSRADDATMSEHLGVGSRLRADERLRAVQQLGAIAAEIGLTTAQLALAWVLRDEQVATAITGASRPDADRRQRLRLRRAPRRRRRPSRRAPLPRAAGGRPAQADSAALRCWKPTPGFEPGTPSLRVTCSTS